MYAVQVHEHDETTLAAELDDEQLLAFLRQHTDEVVAGVSVREARRGSVRTIGFQKEAAQSDALEASVQRREWRRLRSVRSRTLTF